MVRKFPRFRRAATCLAALGFIQAAPSAASAATADQLERVRLLGGLGLPAGSADLAAIEAALSLPPGGRWSAAFLDAAVPAWRSAGRSAEVRAASERDASGPWHQVAERFNRLGAGSGPGDPAVPALATFDLPRYRQAVGMLAGQVSLPWPGHSERKARFTNRLMGHPRNQLGEVADYLAAYYRRLGLAVEQQEFDYQGRAYRNVIATIPGSSPEQVVLADHFDVAPTADYAAAALKQATAYELSRAQIRRFKSAHRTGWPVPGADDNASATAALMEAAHVLVKGPKPAKTIRLLHLNGEEFPGDSYGAKQFVARALARKEPIAAVVVLDMIGVNRARNRKFQIAPGQGARSLRLADHAARAATRTARGYKPIVRLFDDHRSYLYNTDGQVFSAAGYPVILLNEHLNYHEDLERLGYHDEFDRTELMDWSYARAVASTGIAAAVMAAAEPPSAADVAAEGGPLQAPERRVSHFQIELRYSPLYDSVLAKEKGLGRPLADAELEALIRQDLALGGDPAHHDSSVAQRLTTWFPQPGWAPMDFAAIAGELRYLRARHRLGTTP